MRWGIGCWHATSLRREPIGRCALSTPAAESAGVDNFGQPFVYRAQNVPFAGPAEAARV